MQQFIRKNVVSIILVCFIGVLLFVPNAKAYLLKGLLSTGIFNASTKKETNVNTTKPADISFTDKNGNRINTYNLKGKIIFINFWATWCPPCIAEMASINALYNKLKTDPRFVFILADADSNLAQSIAFMDNHQYNLPVYQIAGPISADLFSGSLPTTLIIDTKGNLVQRHEGIANYDTREMTDFLKGL
ncbi:MAG: TlpA disulfide reductase family protein [Chitinophagaceae bacterium]